MSGTEDMPEPVESEAPDEVTPAETEADEPRFNVPHGDEKTEAEAEEEDSSLTD